VFEESGFQQPLGEQDSGLLEFCELSHKLKGGKRVGFWVTRFPSIEVTVSR
jgi:hypothetical protein